MNQESPWAAWIHDKELVAMYSVRIQKAFRAALTDAARMLPAWWNGSLTMTRQGLIDAISQLIAEHVGITLHTLWEESWYLGSRAAEIAIRRERPDFGPWHPGMGVSTMVANETGLRHLIESMGSTVIDSISRTRMQYLYGELGKAIAQDKSPENLASRLEDILQVSSRSEMIAHTEVMRAVSVAAMEHYRRAGISMKEWVTPPEGACKVCLNNEAQGALPLSSPFPSGASVPPQHPRCRCGVVPAGTSAAYKRKKKVIPPDSSNWGGGSGMGAPSASRQAGDGNGSQVSNAYGTSETQRPGTSANSDNAGGEPPRFIVDEVDEWEPDATRKVDENGQVRWYTVRREETPPYPYGQRGLPGGPPSGPSIGTQQTDGDPFISPQARRRSTPAGNDAKYPDSARGRPPNAVGKAANKSASISKEQAHYRPAEGNDRRCGNCVMFHLTKSYTNVPDNVTPYIGNADKEFMGDYFRKTLFTTPRTQLVVMTLQPGQDIGSEIHDGDQIFIVISGNGHSLLNGLRADLSAHSLVGVPKGTEHNIVNDGNEPMRLVTVYGPPQHPPGTVDRIKPVVIKSQLGHCDLVKGRINPGHVCDHWMAMQTEKGKNPMAAGLAVRAADTNRVLMLQRNEKKEGHASGKWELPGGRIDPGETPFQAALREWAEETGIKVPPGKLKGKWKSSDKKYRGFVLTIPFESNLPILDDRDEVVNPDDPQGKKPEALAWWKPKQLRDNPAVRREIADDFKPMKKALKKAKKNYSLIKH